MTHDSGEFVQAPLVGAGGEPLEWAELIEPLGPLFPVLTCRSLPHHNGWTAALTWLHVQEDPPRGAPPDAGAYSVIETHVSLAELLRGTAVDTTGAESPDEAEDEGFENERRALLERLVARRGTLPSGI